MYDFSNQVLALIKLPGEDNILSFTNAQNATPNQFVIQPFSIESKPIALYESALPDFTIDTNQLETTTYTGIEKEEYLEYVEQTINHIKLHKMEKIVISRVCSIDLPAGFNPMLFYNTINHSYPNTCNSFFYNQSSIWMGASPEILLDRKGDTIQLMSLAGTLDVHSNDVFKQKEILEQNYVTTYIKQILTNLCEPESIQLSETKELIAGPVKHILNTFQATLKPGVETRLAANHLHPTPAVAGSPKKEAIDYIQAHENHRQFYAGYLGVIGQDFAKLYVNLRCMQVFKNKLLFYAGGGITEASDPEREWEETELKINTLRRLIL